VADEEGSIFGFAGRAALANADEPLSLARIALARPSVARFTFGVAEGADARLVARSVLPDGRARLEVTLSPALALGAGTLTVITAMLGPAVATNFAAALGAVAATGAGPDALRRAARAMGEVAPVPGRLVPRALRGALVLDDTYNASPRAVRAALEAARELADARGARLVVALGDMLELGALSASLHEEVGRDVAAAGAAVFVACGAEMRRAARSAEGAREVLAVDRSEEAGACLRARVAAGDVVLVKGSRGTRMERAVAALEG
jgi:UDP-N-acetylmuramoyl-tripeptide--D-alanyl-D-alanine ligase